MPQSAKHAAAALCATLLWAATASAAEDYKITRCPPDLPYCIQVTKPALSPAEVAALNTVQVDPREEARKARIRHETGYRDPGAIDLCPPPPYKMTYRDGCHPRLSRHPLPVGVAN